MTSHEQWRKRLDDLEKRAQTRSLGVVPIIEVLTWPDEDQEHFRNGTADECDELIAKHCGPQRPVPPGYDGITQIVVCLHAPEYLRRDEYPGDASAPRG